MKPFLVLLASLVALPAWGDDSESFTARAKVVRTEPQYEWVRVDRPDTKCWDETIYDRDYGDSGDYDDIFPAIVGGAVGGALGHQVGGGRGKDVATVAGAIAGTVIGQRMAGRHDRRPHRRHQRRCRTNHHWVEERQRVGYLVTYRFAGRTFTTLTSDPPGKWIDVRVNLDPLL
jgi:uncharacterized protein YcfJ